ncbi:hypothetical protein PPACK8108_LOCUS11424 [Phakopsora pachyrhizi]|uniref:Uncharacterized protein n=1 Tax=Phakopsora pachyrhizi TaxID=170000 RepID=A0AAV0B566_PHAPC|nr:hypothetical protein PPACK8108_LOCUS11424 [Phakopsora pachyrhizi]
MGFDKLQKGDFELGAILRRVVDNIFIKGISGGSDHVLMNWAKALLTIGVLVSTDLDNWEYYQAINEGQALGTKLKPKGIQFKTVFEERVEEPMSTRSQTEETRDLSNQKEDEFEDKKTLNRSMGRKDDEELQKGGPNKNEKSTSDGLEEQMDGSDLHPTESPSRAQHLAPDNSKQEVVVEFDDKLVPIVSQKAFKKLQTLLKKP